eukprot:1157366-Pelagomonas_calceolata.AAC.9
MRRRHGTVSHTYTPTLGMRPLATATAVPIMWRMWWSMKLWPSTTKRKQGVPPAPATANTWVMARCEYQSGTTYSMCKRTLSCLQPLTLEDSEQDAGANKPLSWEIISNGFCCPTFNKRCRVLRCEGLDVPVEGAGDHVVLLHLHIKFQLRRHGRARLSKRDGLGSEPNCCRGDVSAAFRQHEWMKDVHQDVLSQALCTAGRQIAEAQSARGEGLIGNAEAATIQAWEDDGLLQWQLPTFLPACLFTYFPAAARGTQDAMLRQPPKCAQGLHGARSCMAYDVVMHTARVTQVTMTCATSSELPPIISRHACLLLICWPQGSAQSAKDESYNGL